MFKQIPTFPLGGDPLVGVYDVPLCAHNKATTVSALLFSVLMTSNQIRAFTIYLYILSIRIYINTQR